VALRIISFTVSDRLQAPILYGKTARNAWDELQKVHAPKDRLRMYSLMRRLFRLEMKTGTPLRDHEQLFDVLVQSLSAISKNLEEDEFIIHYACSLPVETFGNWIQTQLAFIDKMSITDFKGRVREEARRVNLTGLGEGLGADESDTAQANFARQGQKQKFPKCTHCGRTNHAEINCYKRITEEYNEKQARRQQQQSQKPNNRGRNRHQQQRPNAHVANINANYGNNGNGNDNYGYNNNGNYGNNGNNANNNAPAYNSIFGGLAYCCKAAVNGRIKRVNGV